MIHITLRADAYVATVKVEGERDSLVAEQQQREWTASQQQEEMAMKLRHYEARDAWVWQSPATKHAVTKIICCV